MLKPSLKLGRMKARPPPRPSGPIARDVADAGPARSNPRPRPPEERPGHSVFVPAIRTCSYGWSRSSPQGRRQQVESLLRVEPAEEQQEELAREFGPVGLERRAARQVVERLRSTPLGTKQTGVRGEIAAGGRSRDGRGVQAGGPAEVLPLDERGVDSSSMPCAGWPRARPSRAPRSGRGRPPAPSGRLDGYAPARGRAYARARRTARRLPGRSRGRGSGARPGWASPPGATGSGSRW